MPAVDVGSVLAGVAAVVSAWATWQNHRLRRAADANLSQLAAWRGLADEWRIEIRECHRERERLKVEVSSMRTLVIALRKVHEGEFPSLPDIEREVLHRPPSS